MNRFDESTTWSEEASKFFPSYCEPLDDNQGHKIVVKGYGHAIEIVNPISPLACSKGATCSLYEWGPMSWQTLIIVSEYVASCMEYLEWSRSETGLTPDEEVGVVHLMNHMFLTCREQLSHAALHASTLNPPPSPPSPPIAHPAACHAWSVFTHLYFQGLSIMKSTAPEWQKWLVKLVGNRGWRPDSGNSKAISEWVSHTHTQLSSGLPDWSLPSHPTSSINFSAAAASTSTTISPNSDDSSSSLTPPSHTTKEYDINAVSSSIPFPSTSAATAADASDLPSSSTSFPSTPSSSCAPSAAAALAANAASASRLAAMTTVRMRQQHATTRRAGEGTFLASIRTPTFVTYAPTTGLRDKLSDSMKGRDIAPGKSAEKCDKCVLSFLLSADLITLCKQMCDDRDDKQQLLAFFSRHFLQHSPLPLPVVSSPSVRKHLTLLVASAVLGWEFAIQRSVPAL
eukprot:CAMPEP_0175048084 /NCGR_PEP_ID=MMETSP0052_2-20121109/5971_1 /TAXON_ID=51329 ORGANISM="Polytomella parva, Strain SAG 63-3" /NCGR_SAMPLE_ID=MMETSP0052_2 /ASSEMBLY_ACC=CAM_ASM_000194 /LENGTH=455 /DNA_ID=CAMNT_0016312065 /DNA_START=108 /DNA_END=1472 /DNA_ORIENTATION=-